MAITYGKPTNKTKTVVLLAKPKPVQPVLTQMVFPFAAPKPSAKRKTK